jgi:hypothetical protein
LAPATTTATLPHEFVWATGTRLHTPPPFQNGVETMTG